MKLGFTTLALFMEPNNDIIDLAKKHGFEIIEILAEGPFFEKDNYEFTRKRIVLEHTGISSRRRYPSRISKAL